MTDLLQPQAAPTWRDHLIAVRKRCTPMRLALGLIAVGLAIASIVLILRPASVPAPLVLPRSDGNDTGASATAARSESSKGRPMTTAGSRSPMAGGAQAGSDEPGATAYVTVHAAGSVNRPGVYALADGARVADVITAAGGLAPDADMDRLNLAARVADGERVYVPRKGEELTPPLASGGVGSPSGSGGKTPLTGPIDLNAATAEDLDALPGVGPATSAAIVKYRERNGRFRSVEELLEVPGIGPAKLEAIRPLVRT